ENCGRVLLLHGASKEVKNYRGQTPFQVAIIAGNFELAEFIKNHKDDSTGKSEEQLAFFNENCHSAHNLSLAFHVRALT
ncbi:SH3 and multiple ankyrin repeat domains protein 2-like, partial [Tachysurus ichikawai]